MSKVKKNESERSANEYQKNGEDCIFKKQVSPLDINLFSISS